MFNYKKLGEGICYFRNKRHLSQDQLSEMVNVGPSHFSRIENGHTKPSLGLLINICNVLNISINDCLNYNDDSGDILLRQFDSLVSQFSEEEKIFFTEAINGINVI